MERERERSGVWGGGGEGERGGGWVDYLTETEVLIDRYHC